MPPVTMLYYKNGEVMRFALPENLGSQFYSDGRNLLIIEALSEPGRLGTHRVLWTDLGFFEAGF